MSAKAPPRAEVLQGTPPFPAPSACRWPVATGDGPVRQSQRRFSTPGFAERIPLHLGHLSVMETWNSHSAFSSHSVPSQHIRIGNFTQKLSPVTGYVFIIAHGSETIKINLRILYFYLRNFNETLCIPATQYILYPLCISVLSVVGYTL